MVHFMIKQDKVFQLVLALAEIVPALEFWLLKLKEFLVEVNFEAHGDVCQL